MDGSAWLARCSAATCLVLILTGCANILDIGDGKLRDAAGLQESDGAAAGDVDDGGRDGVVELDASSMVAAPTADADAAPGAASPDGAPADAGDQSDGAATCPQGAACCKDADCPEQRACVRNQCSETACVSGYRFCSGRCVADGACCSNDDCSGGQVCQGGACVANTCSSGQTLCGVSCIGQAQCCVDEDCTGHRACRNLECSTSCASGYFACGSQCLLQGQCCSDSSCADHFACVSGSCSTAQCASGYRLCGQSCIPAGQCCTDGDCSGNFSCVAGVCSTTSCMQGYRGCGDGCILASACCADRECQNNFACEGGACSTSTCAAGHRLCGQRCIASGGCCGDDDCLGGFACASNSCSTSVCKAGFKRCGGSCIPSAQCCQDSDCAGNFACSGGACSATQCASGHRRCGSTCIPNTGCCGDGDCSGNFACSANSCSATTCRSGFKRCGSACIPSANCCSNSDCSGNFACVSGSCSTRVCAPTKCGITCDMSASCRPNTMFMSSRSFTFATLGGIAGADTACQQMASEAGLAGTFRAWIEPGEWSLQDAANRLRTNGAMPSGWVRPDGRPFINDLLADQVFYPPKVDEKGAVLPAEGRDWVLLGGCNLTFNPNGFQLNLGRASMGSKGWWNLVGTNCGEAFRLYCFGIDRQATLEITPPAGRKAFLADPWPPVGGVAAADAYCQQSASAAGLAGTYRAAIATSTQSAASRFDISSTSAPWVRRDGVRIVDRAADLFTPGGQMSASINVSASGEHRPWIKIFTGVGKNGPQAVDATVLNCANWSSAEESVRASTGISIGTRMEDVWSWSQFTDPCAWPAGIYCLER